MFQIGLRWFRSREGHGTPTACSFTRGI